MPKLREELQFTSLDEQEIIRPKEGVSLYYRNGVMKILHADGEEQTLLAGENLNIDLSQYYTKTETDEVVDNAIAEAIKELGPTGFEVLVVNALPTVGESGKLYLVPEEGKDTYLEYLYVNNKWELVGSTSVELPDLSKYALKTDIPTNLSQLEDDIGHATKEEVELKANAADVYTKGEVTQLVNQKANTADVYGKTEVYTKGEIDSLLESGTGGGGTEVIANPELDGGEEILESIQIEDIKYSLQGQDMTFSESISTDPDAKILKTITIGTDDWKVDKGSVVTPNVELTGDEPVLESVQIDDNTFTLKGEEMIFSETAVEGATVLRNIRLGDDNWAIPEGGSGGSNVVVNQELTGTEEDLVSLTVEGVTYSVMGDEITFSEDSKSGHLLKSITVGNTVWSIDGSGGNYATEEYVDTRVADLVDSAPSTLDTLGELATALQQNQNVVSALDAAITNKADSTKVYTKEEVNSLISNVGGGSVDKYGSADVSSTTTTLGSSDEGYSMGYRKKLEFTIPDYTSLDDLTEIKIIIKDRQNQSNLQYRYLIFDLVKYTQNGGHSFGFNTAIGLQNYWPSNGGNGNQNTSYNMYPTVFLNLNPLNGNVLVYGSTYDLILEQIKIYR